MPLRVASTSAAVSYVSRKERATVESRASKKRYAVASVYPLETVFQSIVWCYSTRLFAVDTMEDGGADCGPSSDRSKVNTKGPLMIGGSQGPV